ncbi:MAG TPA: hypothetical protein VIM94_04680 [Salegentibacter sp.]|uniref:hypothetical protein n=1 Tax=Salegentibacter sp. TaxID=1903072 RepID=UPI002F95DDD2
MVKVLTKTTRVIFWILIILAIVIGIAIYGGMVEDASLKFLVLISGLPFLFFIAGAFGLLWPKIKPTGESNYIIHALILGVLFFILFLLHTWLILPLVCPEFGRGLAM